MFIENFILIRFRPRTGDYFFIYVGRMDINMAVKSFRPRTGDYFFIGWDIVNKRAKDKG